MSLPLFLTGVSVFIRFTESPVKKLVRLVIIILGEESVGHKNKFC